MIIAGLCLMLVGLQPAQGQAASGYMGADAVLKQADAARAERKARGTAGTLAADVEALPARYAKLTPREAASQWWALCERMRKSGGQQTQPDDQTQPVTYGTILGAMPPPADWGAVADLLRSQRSTKKIEQARWRSDSRAFDWIYELRNDGAALAIRLASA